MQVGVKVRVGVRVRVRVGVGVGVSGQWEGSGSGLGLEVGAAAVEREQGLARHHGTVVRLEGGVVTRQHAGRDMTCVWCRGATSFLRIYYVLTLLRAWKFSATICTPAPHRRHASLAKAWDSR